MSVTESQEVAMESAIGQTQRVDDVLSLTPARHLAATFDRDGADLVAGAPLPPGWQWLYFLDAPQSAVIGHDGRTVPGGFLPETGLPRRMWAGGVFEFHEPLRLGEAATCETVITDVARKQGRSGALAFITTEHRVSQKDVRAVTETRNLVFREAPRPGEVSRREEPQHKAKWRREITPDAVLLFRFSALTFNGHRIHYDIDYCRDEEGYPGLVVHGPMLALMMLDLAEREMPERAISGFRYRAVSPVFTPDSFAVCGLPTGDKSAALWIENSEGGLATTAEVTFA
jgi:3-methylfumaryl-CoA hydratase